MYFRPKVGISNLKNLEFYNSTKNRDFVASKMTSAQIAEAQKLAREWKPK